MQETIRRLLAKAPDHSVIIVSIGGFTNLAGLLESNETYREIVYSQLSESEAVA